MKPPEKSPPSSSYLRLFGRYGIRVRTACTGQPPAPSARRKTGAEKSTIMLRRHASRVFRPYTRDADAPTCDVRPERENFHARFWPAHVASPSRLRCAPWPGRRPEAGRKPETKVTMRTSVGFYAVTKTASSREVATLIYRPIFTKFGTDAWDDALRIMAGVPGLSVP